VGQDTAQLKKVNAAPEEADEKGKASAKGASVFKVLVRFRINIGSSTPAGRGGVRKRGGHRIRPAKQERDRWGGGGG